MEWKKVLFYGKSGYAWTDVTNTFTDTNSTGTVLTNPSEPTRQGWGYGGGVEYSVDPHWTVLAEYMFWDFGNPVESRGVAGSTTYYFRHELEANSVTVGASYHFA